MREWASVQDMGAAAATIVELAGVWAGTCGRTRGLTPFGGLTLALLSRYPALMPRLVGINHLAVEVGDVDEAIAFFGRIFDDVQLRGRTAGMAFLDLGDQFIAFSKGVTHVADHDRHIGLVVDDLDETVRRLRAAGVEIHGTHDFLDPWGNRWQLVDYREIQFSKTPRVLSGMGLGGLEKSERAVEELRAKGLGD